MTLLRWTVGVWIVLFFTFLPFPLEYFPDFGTYLSALFLPLTKAVSGFPDEVLQKTYGFSDSIHLYIQTIALLVISIPIAFFCEKSKYKDRLQSYLTVGVNFIMGFFLLKYGIEKLTRLQFPSPEANILYTPSGQLDKDILFWTTMGTSTVYAWFMGIVEIFCAFLLFIPKTRFIAALTSVGIFVNIFAINIGFDITVKLLAFALLSASLFLVTPNLLRLTQFLIGKPAKPISSCRIQNNNEILHRILKGTAIAFIIIECCIPVFGRLNPPIGNTSLGSYEVLSIEGDAEKLVDGDVRRVHLHRDGYFIIESNKGVFTSHRGTKASSSQSFSFNDNSKIHIAQDDSHWFFESQGETEIKLTCKKLNNALLPAVKDNFHWTVEGMIETK